MISLYGKLTSFPYNFSPATSPRAAREQNNAWLVRPVSGRLLRQLPGETDRPSISHELLSECAASAHRF